MVEKHYPYVYIYAFDFNIENPALDTLKEIYHVEGSPTMVINGESYREFLSKKELVSLVKRPSVEETEE